VWAYVCIQSNTMLRAYTGMLQVKGTVLCACSVYVQISN